MISVSDVNKVALSPFDNKRYYENDGINSLAFGHHKTCFKRSHRNPSFSLMNKVTQIGILSHRPFL